MRQVRRFWFLAVGFCTAIVAYLLTPGQWLNRLLAVVLCTVLTTDQVCLPHGMTGRAVAAMPQVAVAQAESGLVAQRSSEFDDVPMTPAPSNTVIPPPYPVDPGPNFPVRSPDFQGIDTNSPRYAIVAASIPNHFEVVSDRGDRLTLEIINNLESRIQYTASQGIEMLFYLESTDAAEKLVKKHFSYSLRKSKNSYKLANIIDPDSGEDSPQCLACSSLDTLLKKFKNANDFESLLTNRIPTSYKITQLLLRGDFIGATWQAYQQVPKSIQNLISLEPLKAALSFLYNTAFNCASERMARCLRTATAPTNNSSSSPPQNNSNNNSGSRRGCLWNTYCHPGTTVNTSPENMR